MQSYNTGASSNQILYNGQLVDETMAEYIPSSYYYFTNQLSAKPAMTMPSTTQLFIGEPAQIDAAGTAQIWNNTSYAFSTVNKSFKS